MSKTPLRLRPEIASATKTRSAQLHQPSSSYVAILIRNYEIDPFAIVAQRASKKLARVNVGMSWRGDLRRRTARLARAAGLNVNSFVEALIAAEISSPAPDLTIMARGSKPTLQK